MRDYNSSGRRYYRYRRSRVSTPVDTEIERQLKLLSATYNWPESVGLHQITEFTLIISSGADKKPGDISTFAGRPVSIEVKVADMMSAVLSAPSDKAVVTPRSEKEQSVTGAANVQWIWDVRPLTPGALTLTLEVFAHVKAKDKVRRVRLRVVRKEIPVLAAPWQHVRLVLDELDPVWKVGSSIAAGIAAILAFFGFRPASKKKQDQENT